MSFNLSAQTGTPITPEQLLGTEEQAKQARLDDAQRDVKKLLRRMSKAGLPSGTRKEIVKALQASAAPRTRRKAKRHA